MSASALRVPLELGPSAAAALPERGDDAPREVDLPEEAARYVSRVHRLAVGDAFVAFDPLARTEADARIIDVARGVGRDRGERVRVALSPARVSTRLPRRAVTLFQGLAKADKMDAIVRDATELGATDIVPVVFARSVPLGKSDAAIARWGRVAVEAARQAGRGDVPEIAAPIDLTAALARPVDARAALLPGADRSLAEIVAAIEGAASVGVFVGPEGGFDDAEVRELRAGGAVPARLGAFVMRTETAATAALAVIAASAPR